MKNQQLLILGALAFFWFSQQPKTATIPPPQSRVSPPPPPPPKKGAKASVLDGDSLDVVKVKEEHKTYRKGIEVGAGVVNSAFAFFGGKKK